MSSWIRLVKGLSLGTMIVPGFAFADDAAVDKLNWQESRGGKLEILGEKFGSGPSVRLFDTFTNDGEGSTPLEIAAPRWFDRGDMRINKEHAHSGSGSAVVADTEGNYRNRLKYKESGSDTPHGTSAFQEIYFSYAIKDLAAFPGPGGTATSFANRSTTKDAWLMLGAQGHAGGGHRADDPWTGNDFVIPSYGGGGFLIHSNSNNIANWRWQGDLRDNWEFGDWNQIFFHAKVESAAPRSSKGGFFGFANDNALSFSRNLGPFMTNTTKEPYWDRIKFGPWYRLTGDNPTHRVLDSIYIATGPNAKARVMIGDRQRLSMVTRLHHGLPVSWQNDRIVGDFSHIDLDSESDWYVFVSTGDGELMDQGIPLRTADVSPESPGDSTGEEPQESDEGNNSSPDQNDDDEPALKGSDDGGQNGESAGNGSAAQSDNPEDGDQTGESSGPGGESTPDAAPSEDAQRGGAGNGPTTSNGVDNLPTSESGSNASGSRSSASGQAAANNDTSETGTTGGDVSGESNPPGNGGSGMSSSGVPQRSGNSRATSGSSDRRVSNGDSSSTPNPPAGNSSAGTNASGGGNGSSSFGSSSRSDRPGGTSEDTDNARIVATPDDNPDAVQTNSAVASNPTPAASKDGESDSGRGNSNNGYAAASAPEPLADDRPDTAGSSESIPASSLDSFVGNQARLEMDDGRTFAGRIDAIQGDDVEVRIDLEGGHVGYHIDRSRIREATVTRTR